jgi:creatinine amidohydrolase
MSYEQSPVRPGEWRFERLTWPEINTAVTERRVIILPIGSVEQHGYHLPLDVDLRLSTAVCHGAGQAAAGEVLVMPSACYGYCHHVMDFPGTMNIEPTTFVKYHLDITRSLAYHGFKRIILVNGHGSNGPLVEQVGRQTNLQTDALCCTFSWWNLVADYWNAELRDSTIPGGCAHACELETAIYMHIAPEDVRSDRIIGARPSFLTEIPDAEKWQAVDLTATNGPGTIVEWTSTYSPTGSFGEPEKATAEKGRLVFERAVDQLVGLTRWFRDRPAPPRVDHHAAAPTFGLPFQY